MRLLLFLLTLTFAAPLFAQQTATPQQRIQQLFLGLDLQLEPEAMAKKNGLKLAVGTVYPQLGAKVNRYAADINTHPLVPGKLSGGFIGIEHAPDDKERPVVISVVLYIQDPSVALETYDALKTEFEAYADKIKQETILTEDYDLVSEHLSLTLHKQTSSPVITISYDARRIDEQNGYGLSFTYYGKAGTKKK